jgi:large subunit ribosomal protein L23
MSKHLADPYSIIKRPMITEKGTLLAEQNQYLFEVEPKATKVQIAQAITQLFDVKVLSVNTTTRRAEVKRTGARNHAKPFMKKAMVTLAEGQSIDMFPTV